MAQAQPEVTNGTAGQQPASNGADTGGFKLKFCTVCASNNNRFVLDKQQTSEMLTLLLDLWSHIFDLLQRITQSSHSVRVL